MKKEYGGEISRRGRRAKLSRIWSVVPVEDQRLLFFWHIVFFDTDGLSLQSHAVLVNFLKSGGHEFRSQDLLSVFANRFECHPDAGPTARCESSPGVLFSWDVLRKTGGRTHRENNHNKQTTRQANVPAGGGHGWSPVPS